MVIQCPNCGLNNRDMARFCRQCGKPLLVPKVVATVTAKCSSTNQSYALVFERTGGGPWILRRTESFIPPESVTDREQVRLEEIAWDRTEVNLCPYCANEALIQCGSCGYLSCYLGVEKGTIVKCVWCGTEVRIEGHIRQLWGAGRRL